jgi:hypothetical protein
MSVRSSPARWTIRAGSKRYTDASTLRMALIDTPWSRSCNWEVAFVS